MEKFETTNAILSFKAGSGDLVGVQWKRPELQIIGEGKLGENFRILLPKPNYEASYFNSRNQILRKLEKYPDRVVLRYGPLKNEQEEVEVAVSYEIRDTGSQLQFFIHVENATDRKLAEVFYGIVGGQQGIEGRLDTESHIPGGFYQNLVPKLFSQFQTNGEDVGVRIPSASYSYPGEMLMGWISVYNPKARVGYYYANQDPVTRVTALYTEMRPYVKRSIASNDNWPSAAELPAAEPIGLTMGWINFPYTVKGTFRGGPIALQVHEGDWHTANALYRAWFDRHFQIAPKSSWLRKEMAWQSVVMLSSEDVIRYRFEDLPTLAADAKRYGVTTLDITGWNVGGLDRGYPDYRPDPRLGTANDFRKALADMRAMGVHPLLFGNIQVADTSTDAFKLRIQQYVIQGRWAPDWPLMGWGQGTIGARDTNSYGRQLHRNLAIISPSHPQFREELIRHYLDRIQDGAEGWQFDKVQSLSYLDFNPSVPTSPDQSLVQGVLTTLDEYHRRARQIGSDAGLAAETRFDRAFPYVDVLRMYMFPAKDQGSMALRHAFPELTSLAWLETPGDFAKANNGLRYGLVWLVAPRFYTDSMHEELTRPLSRYLSELIRIRKQYADLLFHGRLSEVVGADVTGDEENIRYSVFKSTKPESEARAVVVVNFGGRDEIAQVSIPGKKGRVAKISTPFQPDRVAVLPVELTLPPDRAAVVVVEQ